MDKRLPLALIFSAFWFHEKGQNEAQKGTNIKKLGERPPDRIVLFLSVAKERFIVLCENKVIVRIIVLSNLFYNSIRQRFKSEFQVSSLKCFVGRGNVTSASSSSAAKLPSTEEGRAHHEATQDRARPDFRIEECGTRNGWTDAAVSLSPASIKTAHLSFELASRVNSDF